MNRSAQLTLLGVAGCGLAAAVVAVPALSSGGDGRGGSAVLAAADDDPASRSAADVEEPRAAAPGPGDAAVPASGDPAAVAAPAGAAAASPGRAPVPALVPGRAKVDRPAATRGAIVKARTEDGAVAAFASYATWLVASPAAAADPQRAIAAVAAPAMDTADTTMLRGMARDERLALPVESGAYRVLATGPGRSGGLGWVMVEVLTPLTHGDSTRWVVVGGSVEWRPDGWRLTSIRPREVRQPAGGAAARSDAAVRQAAPGLDLPEIGWRTFGGAR